MCADYAERLTGFALLARFTDTDDRDQAGHDRRFRLRANQRRSLAVIAAAFGMSQNHITGAGIANHPGRDITGVRTAGIRVTVLCADQNGAIATMPGDRGQQGGRWADQNIDPGRGCQGGLRLQLVEKTQIRAQAMHLPVPGNQHASCHLAPHFSHPRYSRRINTRLDAGVSRKHAGGNLERLHLPMPQPLMLATANLRRYLAAIAFQRPCQSMLTNFRAFAQSPFALVIIVLLVLGFALYGVSGIFTGSGTAVVVVGNEQISQRELAQAFEREMQAVQEQNPDLTREEALQAGLGDQVLQRLIVQAAFHAKARELGIVTSDRALTTELRNYQAFLNPVTGAFDASLYRSALQNARYAPAEFERSIAEDMTRSQLAGALTAGDLNPTRMAETRYLVQQEQRRIRALILDASEADPIPDPTDEQLQAFIDANPDQVDRLGLPVFNAPEFRAITLVRFQLEDYILDVDLDESILRETYDYQVENGVLGTPAQRSFVQLITPDQATADQVAARLAAGESAEAIAAELGLDTPLSQTDAQAYQVPDSQLAIAIFAMTEGETGAIEGSFGWSAIQITAATDAVVPSFDDQLDALRTEAARAEATNAMYDAMAAFEQERSNGATLEDAAERAGVPLEAYVPLDQYARAQDGEIDFERFQSLASDVLRVAFEQFAGFAINLEQYNETDWFTLRVDDIIPSQPRALEDVREQAEAIWRAAEADTQLQARADEALAQLQAGDDMELVVLTSGGRIETSTLKRDETAGSFAAHVVGQAFSLEPGIPSQVVRRGAGPHMIVIVDEILPADLARAGLGEVEQRAAAIATEINDDILVSAQTALLSEYEIDGSSVDQRLRAAALGQTETP